MVCQGRLAEKLLTQDGQSDANTADGISDTCVVVMSY